MIKNIMTTLLALALLCLGSCSKSNNSRINNDEWTLLSNEVTATVYNAVPAQCNADCIHTASMYRLNLDDVLSQRVIAIERTMMQQYGIHYGDIVKIEGTNIWDGVWQVQDTMNKRFAGQKKIDILVPNHINRGKWENVSIYVPANEFTKIKHSII